MVLKLNMNLIHRKLPPGAPSMPWWVQLLIAVAGGLTFASLLTRVLPPCMLLLGDGASKRWN